MPDQHDSVACQGCGTGFVLTATYRDLLERRGVMVSRPLQCPTCFVRSGPLAKQQGTIKWFARAKHYGFIVTDDGQEVFVHEGQFLNGDPADVRSGQRVRFHVVEAVKGPEALNVELVQAQ